MMVCVVFCKDFERKRGDLMGMLAERRKDMTGQTRLASGTKWAWQAFGHLVKEGHENRSTTEIYLHSIGESEREAMRIFEWVSENSHTESHTEAKKRLANFANPLISIGAHGRI